MKAKLTRKPPNLAKIQKLSTQITELEQVVQLQAEKLALYWNKLVQLSDELYVETDSTTVEARQLLHRLDKMTGFSPLIEINNQGVHSIHIISTYAAAREDHILAGKVKLIVGGK